MSPAPEERTDLGLKFPESVLTKVIRVSCESGSDPYAREFDESAIAQRGMNTFLIVMRVRIVGLPNENAHAY